MTVAEAYTAIRRSNEEKCYTIVYLINNNKQSEAIDRIRSCFGCSTETATEAAHMIKADLDRAKSKNNLS